jgi:hypothetical protein
MTTYWLVGDNLLQTNSKNMSRVFWLILNLD